jgi:MYXO-CTERM domain-containing protein
MRLARVIVALVALALLATPAVARAQTTTTLPPLEDVTLRGRILNANGTPLANAHVVVDAVNDSGIAAVGFFTTLGFSLLTCLAPNTPDRELCPVPNSKRFKANTDAGGRYALTFKNAHRRGIQTDTDYVLSVGVPSQALTGAFVVASYELELQDAVHNAPDLRVWDPAVTLSPTERAYRVAYKTRPNSKNTTQVLFSGKPSGASVDDHDNIDARAVEDQAFSVVANAAKDLTAAGTIYHQRFTAAPVTRKGALVPLSRHAACSATRADGAAAHCGYTDGDLVTPGVVDPNPCDFANETQCQSPITKVVVDLGAPKSVGDVRARCSCELQASSDGQVWHNLPRSGTFGAQKLRYVAVTGQSLGPIPEISVWPPWPDSGSDIGLLPGSSRGGKNGDDGSSPPWLLALLALGGLGYATRTIAKRRRDA